MPRSAQLAEVTVEKGPQKTRDEEKERDPERLEGKGRELLLLAPFQAGGRGGQTDETSECYSTACWVWPFIRVLHF